MSPLRRSSRIRPALYARRTAVIGGLAALVATLTLSGPAAQAEPPAPPDTATAVQELNALTVQTEGSNDGYSRDLFPHWIQQGDNCDTREVVLKRDGTDVTTGTDCYPTSGSWYSEYDGETWTSPSDVDIDHIVPLAEAWQSGANKWTTAERQDYANDLTHSQLIAVTDNVNQEKSDRDPAEWLPPRTAYRCTYARMWVSVKSSYQLTVDSAEKATLSDILTNDC
jgi:Protein of unknown function (DUF1524)